MSILRGALAALCLAASPAMMTAAPASAQESGIHVRSVRVAATDVAAVAEFYKKAFGMHEIRRLEFPGLTEIILNSGATREAAMANPHAPIVVMTRPANYDDSGMAAIILNVPDVDKAVAAVEAAGGTVFRPTRKLADGTTFAFIKDPDGNQVELLLGS